MKKPIIAISLLIIIPVVSSLVVGMGLVYYQNNLFARHANAVVEDLLGDELFITIPDEATWDQMLELFESGNITYIGGKVETYTNEWGFQFKVGTIFFPEVVHQIYPYCSSIQGISENLDDCLGAICYFSCIISLLVR